MEGEGRERMGRDGKKGEGWEKGRIREKGERRERKGKAGEEKAGEALASFEKNSGYVHERVNGRTR